MIESFDYAEFAASMYEQAAELLPPDLTEEQRNFLLDSIKYFSFTAGEDLVKNHSEKFTDKQAACICQVIAEWTFHKSLDLIRSKISLEIAKEGLVKINTAIYEKYLNALETEAEFDSKKSLSEIEDLVIKTYNEFLKELLNSQKFDNKIYKNATRQNNFVKMSNEMNKSIILESLKYGMLFVAIQYWIFFAFRCVRKFYIPSSTFITIIIFTLITFLAGVIYYFCVSSRKN